ncbi:MAG: pseudouridine synthase [Candidatus Acidiferrales bacterium]
MSATPERLQKLIARAGLASRRRAEDLIRAGAVSVNGRIVTALGTKADPACDRIEVGGQRLRLSARPLYYLLHKPRGTVCTASDPQGRRTVFHVLGRTPARVFSVGRLPFEAEGVLLLTNDGDFAEALVRARLPQRYLLKIKNPLTVDESARALSLLRRRHRGRVTLHRVRPGANPWYEVTLSAPREDWLRTAFFRLGHPVEKIRRVALGSLGLGKLGTGEYRELTPGEVEQLLREAAAGGARRTSSHKPAGRMG